jgi:hypothetical protein
MLLRDARSRPLYFLVLTGIGIAPTNDRSSNSYNHRFVDNGHLGVEELRETASRLPSASPESVTGAD